MIPMGLGMVAINCGTFHARRYIGESLLGPMLSGYGRLDEHHADRLPATGLHPDLQQRIDCMLVFMGIGTLLDVGFCYRNRLPAYSLPHVPNWELS